MKIQLAGCVVLDDYGRILLLHRSRGESSAWELPGGKVEQGETAEQAAVRELREELGVKVRLLSALGTGEFSDDEHDYIYTWFQAAIDSGSPSVQEAHIFDDVDYFDLEDMMSLALSANMQVLLAKLVSGEVALWA